MRTHWTSWRTACARGMAALLAVFAFFQFGPARAGVGDIFSAPAPVIGSDPPKAADIKDGDTTVASQTGGLNYSYPIATPPGRGGMAPHLALTYSSQAPTYGGMASGWNWNLSIPEIREDTSQGRMRTRTLQTTLPDPKVDDRFTSTLAGGRPLVLVTEPGDPGAYQYRAQSDSTFARYERMKNPGAGFKWRVYSTDGTIRYFGEASQTPGCTHVSENFAPLTSEVDGFGNQVRYLYGSGVADECRIVSITWGQNTAASVGAFAQVDFGYTSDVPTCWGVPPGAQRDFRSGEMIVTGASKLLTITATAFAPGGSPAGAVHTRQIALGYDATQEACTLQHAPIKLLTSITESAWGVDSPLVTLPPKTFAYNPATTTLADPPGDPHPNPNWKDARPWNLAWGIRHNDERGPTVEAMMLDIDGDGLQDRLYSTSVNGEGRTFECTAAWQRNTGLDANRNPVFDQTARPISLPRLKWRGAGTSTSAGSAEADRGMEPGGWMEGCSLNGQATAFRNSNQAFNLCHDFSSCQTPTDPDDDGAYCNVTAPSKGTACPPGGSGAGGPTPDSAGYRTYLNYRWLDVDSDGLVDLVAAVNGSISVYDIEKGNRVGFDQGEPSISGIPGFGVPGTAGAWPPCPGTGTVNTCFDMNVDGGQTCTGTGPCTTNWGGILSALGSSGTHHVGCAKVIANQGPIGPGQCGVTGGCGGGGNGSTRAPYERCQGLYPWFIYKNNGNGSFASTPLVKYQPVPLESDNGDSSIGGPGIASTNHAVLDFDGDGALDGVVHFDAGYSGGNANGYQVWLGDRTGQIGPKMYYFPTRARTESQLSKIGGLDVNFSKSSAGLLDFNGDGLPDHWLGSANGGGNVSLNKGLEQNRLGPPGSTGYGEIDTPANVKPGNDTDFQAISQFPPNPPAFPIEVATTSTNSRVVDVDGDGRVDVVHWDNGAPNVFFNLAGQLSGTGQPYPGNNLGLKRSVSAKNDGIAPDNLWWQLTGDLTDLDGDGIAEAAYWTGSSFIRARAAAQPPRLLSTITNGRGATTAVTYASMHESAVVVQDPGTIVAGRPKASPITQWVVKSLATTDAFTPGTATTAYVYKFPVHRADDDGKFSFRGFEEVTTTAPSGARTIQRYSYAPDWSGRLATTVVMPKLGSGEGDSDARTVDRTTWEPTPRTLFGGTIKTFHAAFTEHFTCANGQTEAACTVTTPSVAAPGYTRTTPTLTPLASTTSGNLTALLWQETDSLLQAGAALADGDRHTKTTFAFAADPTSYRLRSTDVLSEHRVAGVMTKYARSKQTWDASYRVPVIDEVWFDAGVNADANRATTSRTFDMATGNLTQQVSPTGNPISFEYDTRKLFVIAENEVYTHNLEYVWEYGTGTKLLTRGPQWALCYVASPPTCPGQMARDENQIKVDGLGRTLERWTSINPDPTLDYFAQRKVEINSYVDTPTGSTIPTSVTHQAAIDETAGVIRYSQDKTELDGHGRPIKKIVYALGAAVADQVTTSHYNAEGTLRDVTLPDPSLNTTATVLYDYTYDSLGRAKSIRRPDTTVLANRSGIDMSYDGVTTTATEFVVSGAGQPAVTRTTNDSFGRLIKVEEKRVASPLTWGLTQYAFDPNNNVKQITDAENKVTKLAHDFASRRIGISRINGATTKTWTYAYDKNGNMSAETTPCTPVGSCELNYTTTMAYDAFDHPISRLIAPRAISAPDRTLFAADQESMVWDSGSNGHDQLVQWNAFGGGVQKQQQWRTHDPQGRPTMNWQSFGTAGFSMVKAITHSYTLGGAAATTGYGDNVQGGTWQTVSKVGYDARGLPSTISISVDNGTTFPTTVTQTRNVAGLVTKRSGNLGTGTVESNWLYDKLGRVTDQTVQKVSPNAAVARQVLTYNGNDDPKTLQHFLGSASKTFTYSYDLRHQLTNVTTNTSTYFGAVYGYGTAGRFATAQQTRSVTPAPAGTDLLTRNVNYVYGGTDAEQVTALTNVSGGARFATFTYDDAGNMLTRCMGATFTPTCTGELISYLYDGKDQLRRAIRKFNNAVTGSEEYWYDSDGNRTHVRKLNAAGASTELVWYLNEAEHHITPDGTPAGGTETQGYAHVSAGTPVARINRTHDFTAPLEYQFHGLASNTLAAVDKSTGAINASFSYAPFGEVLEATGGTTGTAAHKRRFNDKVQDDLTALTYYGARYYDKTLIGWTQGDPRYRFSPDAAWSSPRRASCYSFTGQNPLRYLDPDGLDIFDDVVAPLPGFGKADAGTSIAAFVVSYTAGLPGRLVDAAVATITDRPQSPAMTAAAAGFQALLDGRSPTKFDTDAAAAGLAPPGNGALPPATRLTKTQRKAQESATAAARQVARALGQIPKSQLKPSERKATAGTKATKDATPEELSEKAESIKKADPENIPKKTEDLLIQRAMDPKKNDTE